MVAEMIRRFSVAAICSGFAIAASATPLVWTLSGVTFDDGGTASGSFVYDADTSQFSAVELTTTTGSVLPGATFHYVCTSPCIATTWTDSEVVFLFAGPATDLTGTRAFALSFDPTLDNSGNTSAARGGEAVCIDAVCSGANEAAARSVTAGSVSTLLDRIFVDGFDP